jgi:hypothetical protein
MQPDVRADQQERGPSAKGCVEAERPSESIARGVLRQGKRPDSRKGIRPLRLERRLDN